MGAGDLVTLGLFGTASGAQPFTVGQIFRKGDVPAGSAVTSNLTQFQAEIRNRWPDGSARFAVLSGVTPSGYIFLRAGGTPTGGSNVAEPAVEATLAFSNVVDATGADVAGGSFSASLSTARAAGAVAWSRTAACKVREMLGPVMSEFHYYVPTADAHTHVWFFVRAYVTGQTEVETVVENGWLRVAAPGRRTYSVALTVGGTQRYQGTGINQYHHTRWSRADWIGTDPEVVPRHDTTYLQSTGLVPRLAVTALNGSAYSNTPDAGTKYSAMNTALANRPTPFALGNIDPSLGSGGHSDNVGLLPAWDMAFLVDGHAGAYLAVQANTRSGGRFSLHYRDETTGRPARGSQHPQLGINDTDAGISDNAGNSPQLTPAPTGGSNGPSWYYSHGPSLGYLSYLTGGRWSAWEELQFVSSAADFFQSGNVYNGYRIGPWWTQLRVHAWIYRIRAQAAIVAPQLLGGTELTSGADYEQRVEAMGRLDSDIDYYHGAYISGAVTSTPAAARNNVFGLFYMHQDYDERNDGQHSYGGMMSGYNTLAILWSFVAEATTNSRLGDLAAFVARFPVGMMGAAPGSTLWNWRLFAFYQAAMGTGGWNGNEIIPTTFRSSWDAQWLYLTTQAVWTAAGNPASLPADNRLRQFSPTGTNGDLELGTALASIGTGSHVVAMVASIAFAHEAAARLNIPGAETMAQRLYSSDTWLDSVATSFRDYPAWAIRSRRY